MFYMFQSHFTYFFDQKLRKVYLILQQVFAVYPLIPDLSGIVLIQNKGDISNLYTFFWVYYIFVDCLWKI